MRRQRARGNMHHRRCQLAGNLVHVRDHQQQPLRRGEGSGERSPLQCSMQRARGAAFALHLDHSRHLAPNVGHSIRRPLVGPFTHRRRRSNRIDGDHLVRPMGDVGCRFVAVNGYFGTVQHDIPLSKTGRRGAVIWITRVAPLTRPSCSRCRRARALHLW